MWLKTNVVKEKRLHAAGSTNVTKFRFLENIKLIFSKIKLETKEYG